MNHVGRHWARTGNVVGDQQLLAQWQSYAQAHGLLMQPTPLAEGGFQIDLYQPVAAGAPMAPPVAAMVPAATPHAAPNPYAPPAAAMAQGSRCQSCGRHAPTMHMTYRQNIGLIVLRLPKTVQGHLCRACGKKYFWEMTAISAVFGWWGVISFFYTLVSIPANVAQYIAARKLPEPS